MLRIAVALLIVLARASCDVVDTMKDGFTHAKAVESDLEGAVGWQAAGRFQLEQRQPDIGHGDLSAPFDEKPLSDLAAATRDAVTKEFQQKPGVILLAFALRD